MKIAVFKPSNIRNDNAFATGQHIVFQRLNELENYEVTYFVDDLKTTFNKIDINYVKRNLTKEFFLKLKNKLFKIFYTKIPTYDNINFSEFDIVITEGIHYSLISYLENFEGKVIFNDSITTNYNIKKDKVDYLNQSFKNATAVVVNDKIPTLYEKNKIKLKTKTIGHAIDTDKIKFKQRNVFNGKLISIGRLVEEKGYKYIIQAIKNLEENYPFLSLDIYGTGPLYDLIFEQIKELKLESKVRLLGFIDNHALLKQLNDYDAFISHPLEMSYIAEAFHMGNMEAMANGLPVITTDCGGVPYVVKDYAIITEQRNIKSIEKAIVQILENKSFYSDLSKNGRKYIENEFSLEIIVNKWKLLLEGEKINEFHTNFTTKYR